MDQLTAASADLFLTWLNAELGRNYETTGADGPLVAIDGERRLSLAVRTLFSAEDDPAWARRSRAVEKQLKELSTQGLTLWIPPETDIPHGDRSDFLHRIIDAAEVLQPGQRGQVEFPVTLTLKKTGSDASYVHVTGGLAPHWARLTGKAYGQYVLDATQIHRLPEPESRITDLLEWVALLGNGMKPGASSDFKAEDAWTVSRPAGTGAVTLIGAPPDAEVANGTSVRRRLRDALRGTAVATPGTPRALLLVGIFRTMDEENATIALRGSDPSLYSSLDCICLLADGRCKPLFGPRAERL